MDPSDLAKLENRLVVTLSCDRTTCLSILSHCDDPEKAFFIYNVVRAMVDEPCFAYCARFLQSLAAYVKGTLGEIVPYVHAIEGDKREVLIYYTMCTSINVFSIKGVEYFKKYKAGIHALAHDFDTVSHVRSASPSTVTVHVGDWCKTINVFLHWTFLGLSIPGQHITITSGDTFYILGVIEPGKHVKDTAPNEQNLMCAGFHKTCFGV